MTLPLPSSFHKRENTVSSSDATVSGENTVPPVGLLKKTSTRLSVAIVYTASLLFLLLYDADFFQNSTPNSVWGIDKLVHFFLFFLLAFFLNFAIAFPSSSSEGPRFFQKPLRWRRAIVFVIALLVAAFSEPLQGWLTENRSADIYDFVFNAFGIAACFLMLALWRLREKKGNRSRYALRRVQADLEIGSDALQLAKTLQAAGFSAYVVGGFVRDFLLGKDKQSHDIDFTTDAKPEEVEALFAKTIPTGKKHGTISVLLGRSIFEVTTYRKDGDYRDGRRPDTVSFSKNLIDDVVRRDFTVNALAYDVEKKEILDYCGGLEDLRNKELKCIGKAKDRFLEDALRMLRACRFAAQLDFSVAKQIKTAMRKLCGKINNVSIERVREEFDKMFLAKKPSTAINLMQEARLLEKVLPELAMAKNIMQNRYHKFDVFSHTLFAIDRVAVEMLPDKPLLFARLGESEAFLADDLGKGKADNRKSQRSPERKDERGKNGIDLISIRWAALFHDLGKIKTKQFNEEKQDYTFYGHELHSEKIARKTMKRLRFSKRQNQYIALLVRQHMLNYESKWTDAAVRRFISRVGFKNLEALFVLVRSDRAAKTDNVDEFKNDEENKDLLELAQRVEKQMRMRVASAVADLAVNGRDLMAALNLLPGERLGELLRYLLEEVIEDPKKNVRETLLTLAKAFNNDSSR